MVPVSNIELTWGYVEVNQNGIILNPKSLITSGHMGTSRVADLLPYDYVPGNAGDFVPLKLFSKEQLNLDRLQEEVYLHTDKSYYYPGEVIWFKGYMKYNYPEILDSLSAVLYVDLIGPDRKVVQTKMFPIDSGHVAEDIALPGSVQAGNYCLREKPLYQEIPLLIIDGIAFNGSEGVADIISQLSISNILRIDVFKFGSAAAFGARGANGVIAIYTRNGTTPSKQVKGYDKSLFQLETIQGFARPLKFKSPNYNGVLKTNAEPDSRSTIYWAPSVNTNPQTGEAVVSFYAADLETKYRVVVEGVTLSGEPIHAEYFIKVLK